jgi:hypothetical protein
MLTLAHPHPDRAGRVLLQARDQTPVSDHPGEHGLCWSYHEALQHRVDAVRADHHVCRGGGPVGEHGRGAARILAETGAPVPGPHRARGQLPGQQRQQVGPVDPDVLSGQGELIGLVRDRPPVEEPQLRRGVPSARPSDSLPNPEPFQHPQPVRRQRDPRADLGQLLRLLIHPDVDPGPRQRHRRRDPADPAADHHRPQSHVLPSSNGTHPRPTLTPWALGRGRGRARR